MWIFSCEYMVYIYDPKIHEPEVFTFGWWMGMYGGKSPKRHRGYSNNPATSSLDLGIYKRSERALKGSVQTVRKYTTKDGRKAWAGTKELRGTQSRAYLTHAWMSWWMHLQINFFDACISMHCGTIIIYIHLIYMIFIYIYILSQM